MYVSECECECEPVYPALHFLSVGCVLRTEKLKRLSKTGSGSCSGDVRRVTLPTAPGARLTPGVSAFLGLGVLPHQHPAALLRCGVRRLARPAGRAPVQGRVFAEKQAGTGGTRRGAGTSSRVRTVSRGRAPQRAGHRAAGRASWPLSVGIDETQAEPTDRAFPGTLIWSPACPALSVRSLHFARERGGGCAEREEGPGTAAGATPRGVMEAPGLTSSLRAAPGPWGAGKGGRGGAGPTGAQDKAEEVPPLTRRQSSHAQETTRSMIPHV